MWRRRCIGAALVALAALPASAAGAPPQLLALHAVRGGERPHFEDSAGREVLLRGPNVNQLGDYYRKNAHPPSAPLGRADFVAMRNLGFNSVRLLVHWSLLEPAPGQLSADYLGRISQAVAWAKENGIYSLIDMHQDSWGKYIAARPDEVCAPPMKPNLGWDGAPEWATLDGGQPRCNLNDVRELSPAVAQAFTNFWSDAAGPGGVGIQTRLVETWRRLAAKFAGEPAVMGYDLFNEPHPGYTAAGEEGQTIVPYYRRAIAAIRSVDRTHTIFVEPVVTRSAVSDPISMPSIGDDPNLAYAPHIYADRNGFSPEGTGRATEREWTNARREAGEAGGSAGALPLWIGEFGALDPPARDAYNAEFQSLSERFLTGWSHWVWKDTCGDPHTDYGPFPDESMNTYDCARDRFSGLKANRVRHLSRPFPWFAPGQLAKLDFDEATSAFEVSGATPTGVRAPLVVFVPRDLYYRRGLRIEARGLRTVAFYPCAGGTALVTARAYGGTYLLRLTRARARSRVVAGTARVRRRPASACRAGS